MGNELGFGEKVACRFCEPIVEQPEVLGIDFNADAVTPDTRRSQRRGAGAGKRIEHRIAHKAEHPNEAFGQLQWVRRRVVLRGSTREAAPYLLEPFAVVFG